MRPFHLITPPILPSRPPPLLPLIAIKLILPQLPIDFIMRLTHPLPKRISALCSDFILAHEILEILCTHPARVQFSEESHELLNVRLVYGSGILGVGGGYGVEEGPGRTAELFDIWGAVSGKRSRLFRYGFGAHEIL